MWSLSLLPPVLPAHWSLACCLTPCVTICPPPLFCCLQTVAGAPDVRPVLQRRFDMLNWFKRHGYPDTLWQPQQPKQQQQQVPRAAAAKAVHPAQAVDLQVEIEDVVDHSHAPMLVFDFDKTISAWDAGETHCLLGFAGFGGWWLAPRQLQFSL